MAFDVLFPPPPSLSPLKRGEEEIEYNIKKNIKEKKKKKEIEMAFVFILSISKTFRKFSLEKFPLSLYKKIIYIWKGIDCP